MELFKLMQVMLNKSGLEWHIGIGSDGIISGNVDGTDFCYNPKLVIAPHMGYVIVSLAKIIIQALVDKKGEEKA